MLHVRMCHIKAWAGIVGEIPDNAAHLKNMQTSKVVTNDGI